MIGIFFFSKDPAYIQVTLSVIGKFFATAVFGIIYIYTVELFPTSVRSAALGFCSTSSRIGGILAPIIADAVRNKKSYTKGSNIYFF